MTDTARTPLVVVGDALLDRDLTGRAERLAPDAPVPVLDGCAQHLRPGGAALAAWLAARDGRDVTLVTALGDDPASRTLRALLEPWLTLVPIPLDGELPEKTRVLAGDRPVVRVDRGTGRAGAPTEAARAAIRSARALLVSDYGRGTADAVRDLLAGKAGRTPVVWDPHPRGGPPVPGTRLVTPSNDEARRFAQALPAPDDAEPSAEPAVPGGAGDLREQARRARALVRGWQVGAVAVTLGERGALLSHGGTPLLVPAPGGHRGDACGAGDRFAATAAAVLGDGALPEEAVQAAVAAATEHVAAGGAQGIRLSGPGPFGDWPRDPTTPSRPPAGSAPDDAPHPPAVPSNTDPSADSADSAAADPADPADPASSVASAAEAGRLLARVRARGGTVVATGGCFDLLHAGHVSLLQAARRIGDCLVVCVNSDASVRRRKGAGRPINPLADRVRVLRALGCVDAVAVFDEDTPEDLLDRLRPDVWVKGGDYALGELPEADLMESWGGQVVLLPYLDGRSSTRLAERAAAATGGAR